MNVSSATFSELWFSASVVTVDDDEEEELVEGFGAFLLSRACFVFVATMRFDGWLGSAFAMFCIHWPRRHRRSSSTDCKT